MTRILLAIAIAGTFGCGGTVAPDLVITHAKVFTNDTARPWADAIAIRRDRVIGVGMRAEIEATAGPSTRIVDAGGRVVVPGFNDARVDLPLEPPTPGGISALDRAAIARGVTSLQVVAGGPMRSLVEAARQATPQGRWRLIRSPEDAATLSTVGPTATVRQDDEPFLPPQPGVRLVADGVAWTNFGLPGERRSLEMARVSTVVAWAYGAEDPIVMTGGASPWLQALGAKGVPEVWKRKRPRLDLFVPIAAGRVDGLVRFGIVVTWLPSTGARPPSGPGPGPLWMVGVSSGTLLDQGVPLALGSAGQPDPMSAIAAVSAAAPLTTGRVLTREEAVRAMTWGSAYAEKAERDKGWLGPGTLADVAVLSDDVFTVSADRLAGITSVLTVVGGTIVYDPGVLQHP